MVRLLTVDYSFHGTFSRSTEASMNLETTVSCEGDDCTKIEVQAGMIHTDNHNSNSQRVVFLSLSKALIKDSAFDIPILCTTAL